MSIEQFAKFLSEQRKERGLTQIDLAKKLNVTNKAVSKWERGLNYPDISTIEDLAKVFDVTVLELLNGEKKMGQDIKEKESIDKAVSETLDFSKQLIRNQKKNYLNQGLILIIVFLLVLVGYQGYNQMFGLFGVSVTELKQTISDLQTQVDQLIEKSNEPNIYGNGIYYCTNESSIESIQFVSSDLIRIYREADPFNMIQATNSYFRVKELTARQFRTVSDVILSDTYGNINLKYLENSWYEGGFQIIKLIEISEDHKTLYFGTDHSMFFCTFNVKPQ